MGYAGPWVDVPQCQRCSIKRLLGRYLVLVLELGGFGGVHSGHTEGWIYRLIMFEYGFTARTECFPRRLSLPDLAIVLLFVFGIKRATAYHLSKLEMHLSRVQQAHLKRARDPPQCPTVAKDRSDMSHHYIVQFPIDRITDCAFRFECSVI
jgi:hypothetical protein